MLCSKSPIRLESGQEYTFSCDLSFGETATDRVTSENKTLYVPIHVALMTKNALGLIKDGTIDFDELISYQACLELLSQERQYYPGENGNPTSAIGFASGGRSNCYALAQWQYDNNRSPSYTYRRNPYSVSDPVNRNLYDNNTYNIWADEANASNLKRSYPTS